jgi:ATP-binding cassette subfamily B (MDR/TAP) protein 1
VLTGLPQSSKRCIVVLTSFVRTLRKVTSLLATFVLRLHGLGIFTQKSILRTKTDCHSLYLVYLAIAKLVVFYVGTVTISFAAMRTVRALRIDCVDKTLRQEIAFFDNGDTGAIAVKLNTFSSHIQLGIAEKLGLVVQAISALITAFIVALAVQWKLALITICIIPAIVITTGIGVAIDASQENRCMKLYAKAGSFAAETFSSIRVVHAYWSQPRMIEGHNRILDDARREGLRKSLNWGLLYANEFFFVYAGYGLAFWQGIRMYASGEIEAPGKIITYVVISTLRHL